MEIRHTIEILTKDIQDIEKLVANLQNYKEPPLIEIDLALAKLRNLYDILLMIRNDQSAAVTMAGRQMEEVQQPPRTQPAYTPPAPEPERPLITPPVQVQEQKPAPAPQVVQAAPPPQPAPVRQEDFPGPQQEEVKPTQKSIQAEEKPKEILAEKYQGTASINDNAGSQMKQSGMTTRATGQPIESISRNIGINDRFLIIKELFGGDSDAYNGLIERLERAPDFNAAFQYVEDTLGEQMEHDGTQILVNLVRRKYIRSGNV